MKKLLNKSWRGHETWFHSDGDKVSIETRQDVTPILELNKKLRNEFGGYNRKGVEWYQYASIPQVIIEKWRNELGVDVFDPDHAPAVRKLLNDPDWRYLRTTEGAI